VQQITAKTEFSANLAVIRTAQDMTGELLDILA
jgi:flagellar hook protein FlgE